MLFSEAFLEVRLVDFIPIIIVFISTYLIYWYYKKLDKNKEKRKVIDVFIKLKQDLKYYMPQLNNGEINYGSFEGNMDYYRQQQDYLIKLGIIVKNSVNLLLPEPVIIEFKKRNKGYPSPMLKILNEYYISYRTDGGIGINKNEIPITTQDEVEKMLSETIVYANKHYEMNLDSKLAKFN